MALQVWLPLDGNLENKGCCNETLLYNPAPTYVTNGKIGSAVSGGTVAMPAEMTAKVFNNKAVSVSFWIYVNQDTGATSSYNVIFSNGTFNSTTNNRKFSMFQYPTCNDFHCSWQNNEASQTFFACRLLGVMPSYQWTHIAVTYENPVVKVYVNGVMQYTATDVVSSSNSFAYQTEIFHINNNERYLNDLRIYNHCLSQAEVHEISQGLVVHYKLDGVNQNLTYNGGPNSNSTNGWSIFPSDQWAISVVPNSFSPMGYVARATCIAAPQRSGGFTKQYDKTALINGKTYTGSCWARASKTCTVSFRNEWIPNSNLLTLTPEWQFIKWTGVIDTSRTYNTEHLFVNDNLEQGMWIEQCMHKIEEGTRATAWSPHITDADYKQLGYHTENSSAGRNLFRTTPKSYNSAGYRAYQLDLTTNLVANRTYTLQFWNINVSHSAKTASTTGIHVYWGGGYIPLVNWAGTANFTDGHADYLKGTFTITDSQASGNGATNVWLEIYNSTPNASGTMSMSIEKWKIEEGSVATPYIQSFEDNGVSAIAITDSSGYEHNATTYGSVYVTPDSPRYDTSTYFNGTSAIVAGRGGMVTDSITINAWVKYSTWGRLASCTETGGWNFEQSPFYFQVLANGAYRTVRATAQPSANVWHMITGEYDRVNQKVKIFIDGVLNAEANSTTNAPITYHASNGIFIGAEAGNNQTTPVNGYYLTGNISDFRIYSTALSADDIKDLYQTTAKIDNLGNVHAFELNETSMASMTKTGIAKYAQFSEYSELVKVKVDPKTYIEPDGSAWARIFHHNNPASGVFNSTDNFVSGYVYLDADRWFDFGICNNISKWEIMLKEKATINSEEFKFRWVQTKNPMTATYADVASVNITKNTTTGYTSFATGGLYLKNGETYLCTNNGNQGNWWGAVGSWNPYSGRLPAWNGVTVTTGFEDVYIRIDNLTLTGSSLAKISKSKRITANEFVER